MGPSVYVYSVTVCTCGVVPEGVVTVTGPERPRRFRHLHEQLRRSTNVTSASGTTVAANATSEVDVKLYPFTDHVVALPPAPFGRLRDPGEEYGTACSRHRWSRPPPSPSRPRCRHRLRNRRQLRRRITSTVGGHRTERDRRAGRQLNPGSSPRCLAAGARRRKAVDRWPRGVRGSPASRERLLPFVGCDRHLAVPALGGELTRSPYR
jgi:hypothetical protein